MNIRKSRLIVPAISFITGYFLRSLLEAKIRPEVLTTPYHHTQFLVILILSAVPNYDRRRAIRDTWAAELSNDVRIYFVIGIKSLKFDDAEKLLKENDTTNDLLLLNEVEDSFHALTQKVIVSMSWLTGENNQLGTEGNITIVAPFHSFQYLLKCDDDSYVRVNDIVAELQTTHSSRMLYWGYFDGRAKVKKSGKYKEVNWNNCDSYLPYALGGGYLLAEVPVKLITKNARHWRRYLNEDTSVGAWLANFEGIERRHDPRFDTEYLSRGCHQSYLITHKITSNEMRKIHQQLVGTGSLCAKEYRTRLSYIYDWNALPSKCCQRNNPKIP